MLLSKKKKLDADHKDINKFCGLVGCNNKMGLEQLLDIDKYKAIISDEEEKKQKEVQIKDVETEHIFENDKVKIIHPLTKESAQKYGAHTHWCTAGKCQNMFDYYNKKGPLYIIITKADNEKYQFHFPTENFMDKDDKPIDLFEFFDKFPDVENIFLKTNINDMLLFATRNKQWDRVDKYLDKGADIKAKINNGNTILILAAQLGEWDRIDKYLKLGADINAKNKWSDTLLLLASLSDEWDRVDKYLKLGADINAQNDNGYTITLLAAMLGKWDRVYKYLKLGANINSKTSHGDTVRDIALKQNKFHLIEKYYKDESL